MTEHIEAEKKAPRKRATKKNVVMTHAQHEIAAFARKLAEVLNYAYANSRLHPKTINQQQVVALRKKITKRQKQV